MRILGMLATTALAVWMTAAPSFAAPEPAASTTPILEPEASKPDPNTPPEAPSVAPAPSPVAPQAETPLSTTTPVAPKAETPPPPAAPALDPVGERIKAKLASGKSGAGEREDHGALQAFYADRNYNPVWVDGEKLSKRAEAAIAEIHRADNWGLKASDFVTPHTPSAASGSDELKAQLADAEIKLDLAILKYSRYARGGRLNPSSLSANLDRRPVLFEPKGVMAGIAGSDAPEKYLQGLHPQHPQFERLRQKYLAARKGTLTVEAPSPLDERDDRRRRNRRGEQAAQPVQTSQSAMVRRLLANMEEWRWMPQHLGALYVMDNIPEYMTRVVKNNKVIFTERIVVGQVDKQTPVFSQGMEFIVFHPEWAVPDGIKTSEILPALRRSSGNSGGDFFGFGGGGGGEPAILRQHGLKVSYRGRPVDAGRVNWSSVDIRQFQFSQPPSEKNVLGVVKFRFPNKHDVYMHDTPTKGLFNASVRTFSHGCMRVQNPVRLAEILLQEDRGWDAGKVASLVAGGPPNNSIALNKKIPVHVTYFTVWVDDDGKLRTFADPYGHEERISAALEGRAPNLVAYARPNARDAGYSDDENPGSRRRSRVAQTTKQSGPQDWLNGLFGN